MFDKRNFGTNSTLGFLFLALALMQEYHCCFLQSSKRSRIISNDSLYLPCHCNTWEGQVDSLKWMGPNGQEIPEPGIKSNIYTLKLEGKLVLHVNVFTKDMSGVYTCMAVIKGRNYALKNIIEAHDKPYIVKDKEQFLIKGENSEIVCEVKSDYNSKMAITWFKDEEEIINNQKYNLNDNALIIKNVNESDAAVYKCFVVEIDTGDSLDQYFNIEVTTIPEIENVNIISHDNIMVGGFLKLECNADGNPEPTYAWRKVDNEKRNITWKQDNNIITFDNLKADDSGTYVCSATNKAGNSSRETIIKVLVPPQIEPIDNVTLLEGSTLKIVCTASGQPAPEVTFTSDDVNVEVDPSIIKMNRQNGNQSLVILNFLKLERSHDGIYTCNASNVLDSVSESTYLSVEYPPTFQNYEEIVYGWKGIYVNMSCAHESNPEGTVEWSYGLEKISNQLNITALNDNEKYGTYKCTVRNKYGTSIKVIKLVEAYPPPPILKVTVIYTMASSVTFEIIGPESYDGPSVIGYIAQYDDVASYYYTDIHRNRTWSIDRPYKVDGLKPGTEYYFKFAPLNEVGVGTWSDTLNITTPEESVPEPPSWIDEYSIESFIWTPEPESYTLRWKSSEFNGQPIDHYIVRYCPEGEILNGCIEERVILSNNIKLQNLTPNTTYHIELFAHNSQGSSLPVEMYIRTPNKVEPILSASAIIGLSVIVVIICLLILDIVLLFWKQQGLIASLCYKKNKKDKQDAQQSRDKKGLLKDNGEQSDTLKRDDNNGHKEFEYNKTTGIITGKHSAV